jgi:hypothetical protein
LLSPISFPITDLDFFIRQPSAFFDFQVSAISLIRRLSATVWVYHSLLAADRICFCFPGLSRTLRQVSAFSHLSDKFSSWRIAYNK